MYLSYNACTLTLSIIVYIPLLHCTTASGLLSFTSSSCVCKDYSDKIMSELAYIYRSEIPMDDLPSELLSNCIHMCLCMYVSIYYVLMLPSNNDFININSWLKMNKLY